LLSTSRRFRLHPATPPNVSLAKNYSIVLFDFFKKWLKTNSDCNWKKMFAQFSAEQ
jgi:hypothetical protein